jgi:hypothetical protein
VQIIFDAFNDSSTWQNGTKIWCSVQALLRKIHPKISAEILVKNNYIFCAIFLLLPLGIAQIGWELSLLLPML